MGGREEWLERLAGVKRAPWHGRLAPHKPLLLLYLLARVQQTGSSETAYAEAESVVDHLLVEFGPYNQKSRSTTAYPFHHLETDGFWSVTTDDGGPSKPSPRRLRSQQASGRLDPELEELLRSDPAFTVLAAHAFLDEWPESLQPVLAAAVALDLESAELEAARTRARELTSASRRRDVHFRTRVLMAYEYRCAFCEFDGRLGTESTALEAAHLRWWRHDGPDEVGNGLCLCSIHHALLDRGVLGLDHDHRITVSRHFVGRGEAADRVVLDLLGRPAVDPQPGDQPVEPEHIDWHAEHVFRQPARTGP